MNADVFRRIELLRAWLEASPERFIAGELPSGNPSPPEEAQRAGYAEFLRHCDGGRFGPIDFFGGAQLPFEQGPADLWRDAVGDALVVGSYLSDPMVLRENGLFKLVALDSAQLQPLGSLGEFLEVLVGPGYLALFADAAEDPWGQALAAAGLLA